LGLSRTLADFSGVLLFLIVILCLTGKHRVILKGFQRQIENADHQVSLLIAVSIALHTNLLEPFVNVLPEELRIIQREKDLNNQIDDLKKQKDDTIKERDIYKNILMQGKS